METIVEAGPGGHFLDKLHTVHHYRAEHWQPTIWSRQMVKPWLAEGGHLDMDKAREMALELQRCERQPSGMSETLEREVLQVIERARKALVIA